MKTTTLLLSLAAAVITSAQDDSSYYNETSAPFHLIVTSEDGRVNDTLSACHIGAAIESLCRSNGNYGSSPTPLQAASFNFNTSIYAEEPVSGLGVGGILTYVLETSYGGVPSSASFSYNPISNLALPILSPGDSDAQIMAFDTQDDLAIQSYTYVDNTATWSNYYRWYTCDTSYSSYRYNALAWGLGASKPDNPSCVAVNVTRVFL
ncbi:hypothetical protein BDW02DRAFT_569127 [Decorospora gaudefroyi]|uniref:Uncharacterized protein n=1 Tax=Decorospora gaudefroyi TaxID=184978 RepID=A0A6A5KLH1_9PLEO|nr:hypothetical protein BDW02DRAFT_569127 [Decorospora gaudefroyi]